MLSALGVDDDEPCERRTGPRHVPVLQLASVQTGGHVRLGLVLNISASGMSLRLATDARRGQAITVCLREFIIEGAVAWLRGGKVGVRFFAELPPSVLAGILSALEPRMRAPRLSTNLTVKFRHGAALFQASLQNISPLGAMLTVPLPPSSEGQVVVTLPEIGSVPGQIRWNDGTRIGIMFNRALHLKDLGTVLDQGSAVLSPSPDSRRS